MKISQILFSQGFGTRRDLRGPGLQAGRVVSVAGRVVEDEDEDFDDRRPGLRPWRAAEWPFHADKALVLLNKPAGYECSQKTAPPRPA